MERRQRDSLAGLFEGDEEGEQDLDMDALGRGLQVMGWGLCRLGLLGMDWLVVGLVGWRHCVGCVGDGLIGWLAFLARAYRMSHPLPPYTYKHPQKHHQHQDDGEEITFDFENDDNDDAAATSKPPTPDDDPYVLWPPEVEKLPLGDICFLLRSGVIAAKNVPERRAGAFCFFWGGGVVCGWLGGLVDVDVDVCGLDARACGWDTHPNPVIMTH